MTAQSPMETGATAESSSIAVRSEEMFHQGLAHLKRRDHQQAASCFQQAIELHGESPGNSPPMKYFSYLGLALSMDNARSGDAVKLCRKALKREFYDADLLCNMGIVYLRNGQRGPAFAALERGLKLDPNHYRIRQALERSDRRKRPVFGFLSRDHLVNRIAGRLRWRLTELLGRRSESKI